MQVTIYHNPACGTSRNVLALIRQAGVEPQIVEYLKTPLNHAELTQLASQIGGARAMMREKESLYAEKRLANPDLPDARLIEAMVAHPILMNRPIVVTARGARLCRPADKVLEILPQK